MLLASPVFGAQNTPVMVRVLTTFAISGALSFVVQQNVGSVPSNFLELGERMLHEAMIGLLIGGMMTLALQMATLAGSLMDLQTGLSAAHTINPVDGHSSTLISQFKFMLSLVIFLTLDAHHLMIRAFVAGYQMVPANSQLLPSHVYGGLMDLLGHIFMLAVQIAAPVLGVSLVTDAALGLVNRAVPQMPAMLVGMPVKICVGLIFVGLGLPMLTSATSSAVALAIDSIGRSIR